MGLCPQKPRLGDVGDHLSQARFLGVTSHHLLFSFSCQGDMGALGPIGYPGPKGVKVNKSHP